MQLLPLAVHRPGSDPEDDDSVMVQVMPAAVAWIEEAPGILGCLLHLVDGTTLHTMPVHGDPDEMAKRVAYHLTLDD